MANRLITVEEAAREMAESFNRMADEHGLTTEQRVKLLNAIGMSMGGFPPEAEATKNASHH